MKNNQQEPNTKPLWGLKSKPLTHAPKEEKNTGYGESSYYQNPE